MFFGPFYGLPDLRQCFGLLLQLFGISCKPLVQRLSAERFAEPAGLKRRTDPLPGIVQRSVHKTVIGFAVLNALYLVYPDIEKLQLGVQLRQRPDVVPLDQRASRAFDLLFDVPGRIVQLTERGDLLPGIAFAGRVKSVFLLHFPAYRHSTVRLPVVVDLASVVADAVRNDMQVFPVDVRVQIDQIRLPAVSEFLHKLGGEGGQLSLGQLVLGRRIQRDMDNGFFDPLVKRRLVVEGFQAPFSVERTARPLRDALRSEYLSVTRFDFDVVVSQYAVDVVAG